MDNINKTLNIVNKINFNITDLINEMEDPDFEIEMLALEAKKSILQLREKLKIKQGGE